MNEVKNCLTCGFCEYIASENEFKCICDRSEWFELWVDMFLKCSQWKEVELYG